MRLLSVCDLPHAAAAEHAVSSDRGRREGLGIGATGAGPSSTMTENALFLLPALRRARDLIDREYAEPLDLDTMAAEAGYSRFHFARAFAGTYGETPRAYLTRRRIERAKTLLRTANLSVTEVCFLVGFSSV